ncbi:MAG TPA: carboxypeptidase-like regulatory domain-containing protein [Acidobacteriaceae bacterium]|jgi:hypothetical protein|nr:carboxypeptidase-like regulatory domain-containing protein [Acidobacteriaceae bacterium]
MRSAVAIPGILLGLLAQAAFAQVNTATLSGVVQDPAGRVVPDARMVLDRLDTGAQRFTVTDAQGHYVAAELEPGTWAVEAEKAGFATEVRQPIALAVGGSVVVNFSLRVGSVTEKVLVTAAPPLVNTTESSMGYVVGRQQIQDLPLNGRNYTQLTLLVPGVVNVTTFGGNSFFGLTQRIAVAGARPSSGGVYLLDGTNVMSFFNDNAGNAGLGTALGVDAIQEFKVETNTFSPEYARSGASVINAISRSGTNDLHGSAYEFIRNSAVDARNYFDGSSIPPFRRNQFGISLGGPILRDRAFYFVNYEGLRQALGETELGGSPTMAARQGNLPSGSVTVSPAIQGLLNLFPLPNGPDLGGGVGLLSMTATQDISENYVSARVDQQFSSRDHLLARATVDNGNLLEPFPIQGTYIPFAQGVAGRNRYLTLQETRTISPLTVNTLRLSFNRSNSYGNTVAQSPALDLIPGVTGRAPGAVTIGGVGYVGPNPIIPYYLILNTWELGDDLSAVRGRHFVKAGFEWQKMQDPYRADLYSGGSLTFNTLQDFLTANPYTFVVPLPGKLYTERLWNQNVAGFYATDSWRAAKTLTFNLGARYEFITNPTESHGFFSALLSPGDTTLAQEPHVFVKNPSLPDLAPRVGFAWDVSGDGKTSVRGGVGLFFQEYMPRDYAEYGFNPPQTVIGIGVDPGFPISAASLFGLPPSISLVTGYNITKTPYTLEYNLNLQRQISPGLAVQMGGVFSGGRKLLSAYDYNQPLPNATLPDGTPIRTASAQRPNPAFSSLQFSYPITSSNYSSMVVTVERKLSGRSTFFVGYTWSHSLDTQSNEFSGDGWNDAGEITDIGDMKMDYGSSTFDVRHNLTFDYVYLVPSLRGAHGVEASLLNGWQLTGIGTIQSGVPFSVENGFDRANTMQTLSPPEGSERPDLVPGRSNNPVLGSPGRWFDPAAFMLQPAGAFGDLGRDTVRGPGLGNFDAGLFRTVQVGERLVGLFRFEVFNVFNRANFAVPTFPNREVFLDANGTVNPQAGEITQTVDSSRQLQLSLRMSF